MENLQWPLVSLLEPVQRHYESLRRQGESHNIAKMCATGQTPAILTDDVFLEGRRNQQQFADQPWLGARYRAVAEEHGTDITGKVYVSGLAAYPGDPRAWVSSRGEVRTVLEERGWSSDGAVTVRGREPEERPPDPGVDPRLIDREVAQRVEAQAMLGCSCAEDLREKLTALRSWKSDAAIAKGED